MSAAWAWGEPKKKERKAPSFSESFPWKGSAAAAAAGGVIHLGIKAYFRPRGQYRIIDAVILSRVNVSKCWLGDFALVLLALVLEDVGVLRNSNENTPRRLTRDRNLLREGPRIIIVGSSLVVVIIGIGIRYQ